jgi:hypothetical protein
MQTTGRRRASTTGRRGHAAYDMLDAGMQALSLDQGGGAHVTYGTAAAHRLQLGGEEGTRYSTSDIRHTTGEIQHTRQHIQGTTYDM